MNSSKRSYFPGIRLSLGVLILLLGWPSFAPSAPDYAFFRDGYRGDPSVTLAVFKDKPITERDLYLFLLLAHMPNPDLAQGWDSPQWEPVRKERKAELAHALHYMGCALLLGENQKTQDSPYLDFLSLRWALYPVYALVWTDEIVAPDVQIYPEDVAYYIRQHRDRFFLPEQVQFYWAQFPSPIQDPPEERRAVREKAEEIRRKLLDSGASLSTVSADYPPTTSLVADGGLYTIPVGSSDLDPLIEAAIRDDPVRQISPVVETRDGFNLVELRAKLPALLRPEEESRQEASQRLFYEFLPKQFDHRLEELRRAVHPVDRTSLWPFLADETILLDIGRTDVTKEDFGKLFPEVVGTAKKIDIQALRERAGEYIKGEIVAQDCEAHYLDFDPNLNASRPMAEAIRGVAGWYRRFSAETPSPSDTEIRDLWKEKKDLIYPPFERHYYRLAVSPNPSAAALSEVEVKKRVKELKETMTQFRQEAMEVMMAYRASTTRADVSIDPTTIITRWQRGLGRSYPSTSKDLGFRVIHPPTPFPSPELDLPPLNVGEMSPPRYEQPGVLAAYFVVGERRRETPPSSQIRSLVTEYLSQIRAADAVEKVFQTALDQEEFRWAPALKP